MKTELESYQSGQFDLHHHLSVQTHEHTALITLNTPPANTWDLETLTGLTQALAHLDQDNAIQALIITGAGRESFSAGLDLYKLQRASTQEAWRLCQQVELAVNAIKQFRGVSIAAINGNALGTGLECALACDLRIAATDAQFAMPQASLGLIACANGITDLTALVGLGWAKRLLLCGERITAERALQIGLIEQTVESGSAVGHALLLSSRIPEQSPRSIARIKSLLRQPHTPVDARDAFTDLFGQHDAKEGIQAFLQGQPPRWKSY